MNTKKLIFTILFASIFCIVVGCGGTPYGATKVGTPTTNLPTPEQEKTANYLEKNPFMKGSAVGSEDGNPELVGIVFDAKNGQIEIFSDSGALNNIVNYTIADDGSIKIEDENIKITVTARDSENFPYDVSVDIVSTGDSASMFADSTADKDSFISSFDPETMCLESETNCFDTDSNLVYASHSRVKGSVRVNDPDGDDCGLTVTDRCETDGELLAEAVCDSTKEEGYKILYVECNCQSGKCLDDPDLILTNRNATHPGEPTPAAYTPPITIPQLPQLPRQPISSGLIEYRGNPANFPAAGTFVDDARDDIDTDDAQIDAVEDPGSLPGHFQRPQ